MSSFSSGELDWIIWAWRYVREDYLPFDINVTTDEAVYLAAPGNRRIRCVVTDTDTARPGVGGVAYTDLFNRTGDIPCWAFNDSSAKSMAMTVSHEVGHTFGLAHDGSATSKYHFGHGSGATSWGPIMGAPWGARVVTWTKGDHTGSTNSQDDLDIITRLRGVG